LEPGHGHAVVGPEHGCLRWWRIQGDFFHRDNGQILGGFLTDLACKLVDVHSFVEGHIHDLSLCCEPERERRGEGQFRVGRESLGVRQRQARPANRTLPVAQHIKVRNVADPITLAEPDTNALCGHSLDRTTGAIGDHAFR